MGLKKELDVFQEYCKTLNEGGELEDKDVFEVAFAVETLKNVANKIDY